MNDYMVYINGESVSLADFLKKTGLTEQTVKMIIDSGIPMKTMKGKTITFKVVKR